MCEKVPASQNCPSNTYRWAGEYNGASCYGYLSINWGQTLGGYSAPANCILLYDVKSQAGFTNQYAPGVGTAAQITWIRVSATSTMAERTWPSWTGTTSG